jgi:hypothetical protein
VFPTLFDIGTEQDDEIYITAPERTTVPEPVEIPDATPVTAPAVPAGV